MTVNEMENRTFNYEVITSAVVSVVSLGFLMVFWPNFIHETLHYIVLMASGIEGYITFDFVPPIQPTTTHIEPITTVWQGILFRILPSLFSIAVVAFTYYTREDAALVTHIILPTYLTFDLAVNLLGFHMKYNDFVFLQAAHPLLPYALALLVAATGLYVVIQNTVCAAAQVRKNGLQETMI